MIRGRDFASPVFRGGRFESKTLVVDVLPDLAAYRDLVVDLAKRLVLDREPGRKRVPKGFVESFQIGISAVEGGSAIPVLTRIETSPAMPWFDIFDEARDLIDEVVAAAGRQEELPKAFPLELAKGFNQFGRGLRENEYIELRGPGATSGPRYDRVIRKSIVLKHEKRYEDTADVTGWIAGGVIDRQQVTIRREGEALLDCECSEDLVRWALTRVDKQVRLLGLGSFDSHDRLERVLRVDEIIPADEPDDNDAQSVALSRLAARFEELAALPEGWFEEGTPPLDRDGLGKVHAFLLEAMKEGAPAPHVYPTPEGEARAEWSFANWEVSATFDLREGTIWMHATDVDSDADRERDLVLTNPEALRDFTAFLESFFRIRGL